MVLVAVKTCKLRASITTEQRRLDAAEMVLLVQLSPACAVHAATSLGLCSRFQHPPASLEALLAECPVCTIFTTACHGGSAEERSSCLEGSDPSPGRLRSAPALPAPQVAHMLTWLPCCSYGLQQ